MDARYAYMANDRGCVSGGVAMCAGARATFHSKMKKRVALSCVYGGGVRGDGHGLLRDGFDAVYLQLYFPGQRGWVYHGKSGYQGQKTISRGQYIRRTTMWLLPIVITLVPFITAFGGVLLTGSLKVSTYRRQSSILMFSPSRCAQSRFVFTATL